MSEAMPVDREAVELQQHRQSDQCLNDKEGRRLRHADLPRRNRPRPRPFHQCVEIAIGNVVPGAAGAAHGERANEEQRNDEGQLAGLADDAGGQRRRPPAWRQQQPGSDRPIETGEPQIGPQPRRRAGVDPVAGRISNAGGRAAHLSLVPRFRSSWSIAAPSDTNFGNKRGTGNSMFPVPLLDLTFLIRTCGNWRRNFKSAALVIA